MTERRLLAFAGAAVGVLALVAYLLVGGGAPKPPLPGIPDPGALTDWGLPLATGASAVLLAVVVACVFAPLLSSADVSDPLSEAVARPLWWLRWVAAAWGLVVLAQMLLGASDQFAVPAWRLGWIETRSYILSSDLGRGLAVQLAVAVVLAVASRLVVTVKETFWLLAAALLGCVPVALTGHANTGGSHDAAVVSLGVHLVSVLVWVGGVVSLAFFLRSGSAVGARAARRFSHVAVWMYGAVAVSGVVNAAIRLGSWSDLGSGYGIGVIVKAVLLVALGALAWRVRSRLAHGSGSVARLLAAEVVLMAAAMGVGAALSRTPTPVGTPYTSIAESLLSGPVPPAPTFARLLTGHVLSGIGLLIVLGGAATYAAALASQRRAGHRWPAGKAVCWFVGLALVAYATLGGLGEYSHVMFSYHMVSHMVLSMVAPVFLVLGDAFTLFLRALPGPDVPGASGPRQWLSGLLRSRYARVVSHPLVTWVLFVGSLYAIYFTGLYEWLMQSHLGHAFMEFHFLAVGYLFFEGIVGSAPIPRRPGFLPRLAMMVLAMPFHAFFAIAVMNSTTLIGGYYYLMIDAPYVDLAHDQYVGGSLTWALSEVPLVILIVVIVAQWFRSDSREAARNDRRADADGDAELEAYNAMLAARAQEIDSWKE